MKLITTLILFLIIFIASANDCVVNNSCNYSSETNLKINLLLEKPQAIIHSSSSHNDHEFVIDIEEEEEDEEAGRGNHRRRNYKIHRTQGVLDDRWRDHLQHLIINICRLLLY